MKADVRLKNICVGFRVSIKAVRVSRCFSEAPRQPQDPLPLPDSKKMAEQGSLTKGQVLPLACNVFGGFFEVLLGGSGTSKRPPSPPSPSLNPPKQLQTCSRKVAEPAPWSRSLFTFFEVTILLLCWTAWASTNRSPTGPRPHFRKRSRGGRQGCRQVRWSTIFGCWLEYV